MPRVLIPLLGLILLAGSWLWLGGGLAEIGQWAAEHQRTFQNEIALSLRGIRAGQPGALLLLLGVCFAYGFFHAIGPGHGKVVIGGYGLGSRVAAWRLVLITLAASLGQAVTAVALVYGGIWLFSLGRDELVGAAENTMAPLAYGAICLIGVWLAFRGVRRFWTNRPRTHQHADGGEVCGHCGHRHGPTLEEASGVSGLRDAAIVIAGIAIRPCTGALFVLVITYTMGIAGAGIAGAFVMALGTAAVTIAVGLGAVGLRGGILRSLADGPLASGALPVIEIAAGTIVFTTAAGLLFRAL
jgi:ABC-type nickel/cobalt efflux system permease component RcnA